MGFGKEAVPLGPSVSHRDLMAWGGGGGGHPRHLGGERDETLSTFHNSSMQILVLSLWVPQGFFLCFFPYFILFAPPPGGWKFPGSFSGARSTTFRKKKEEEEENQENASERTSL